MKKINIIKVIVTILFFTNIYGGGFLKQFVKNDKEQKLFVGIVEEKEKQLESLKKEYEEYKNTKKSFEEKVTSQIEEINTLLKVVENNLKKIPEDEFLIKKQASLKEAEQVLKDTLRTREDVVSVLDEFIAQLKAFSEDPQFESFKKKHKLQERLYYSFEDLQNIHDHILDQERLVVQLTDQEKSLRAESENRKRNVAVLQEEREKKQQEIQTFVETAVSEAGLPINIENEKELLRLEERLFKYKTRLNELKLKEINYKILFVEFQLFIAKSHLDLFKKHLRIVKPAIIVGESDVALAEEALTKEQQRYFAQKDTLRQEREKVVNEQKSKERELNALSKQLNVSLGRDLDEWSRKPKQTIDSYLSFAQVGELNTQVLLLSKTKDLLDAQIDLENEKFNYKKIRTDSKKTYHKIPTFLTEEEIKKEINEYDIRKKDAQDSLKLYQTKINMVANQLNQQKKVIDNIKLLRDEAEKQKDTTFKDKKKEYERFVELINVAEENIKKQIDVLGKLTGVYSGITSELNSVIRLIDFISAELQASTIWYRPAYAITLEGVKNIVPDATAFFNDIRLYITQFNFTLFVTRMRESFSRVFETLMFIFKLLFLFGFLLLLRRYEQRISNVLFSISQKYGGLIGIGCFLLGTIITFVSNSYRGIFVVVVVWLFCGMIPDPYLYILFYLFSIPYLLYLANRMIKLLIRLNEQNEYVFLPEDFQRRFELVFSTLLYASIVIFFFRQAFMLSSIYLRSELPNILLAVNFIILQISLIFLITKEQIVGIIPDHIAFGRWIREQVDQYYYLILAAVITIIVMMNPYVGFGRLVLYLLWGIILTALLVKALSLLHGFIKRTSSFIFFSQEETVVRERFSYAKTWFGLVIIASFVVLGFIGFILAAKIWGWEIGLVDVRKWLEEPILLEETTHPITTLSLLKIILFVLGGLIAAYALKSFVLARIFDLLLVESGVQHTVTSIVQYIVIIIAVFIGFQSVGLGVLIGWLFTALALSIGLYIKDPISDFVSYFIILVQRPVKIGDYVQIDPATMGVVRKITPRSVVLRRKNSTTIVVPNSYVVSKSIENWNYVRNFIAVDDITLLVSFKEDAQKVKDLLYQAVESHPNILKNPRPIIRLSNFSEIGYEFMVRGFISSAYTLEMWDIASDIRILINKTLKENNIQLAIPIRRVFGTEYFDTNTQQNKTIKE